MPYRVLHRKFLLTAPALIGCAVGANVREASLSAFTDPIAATSLTPFDHTGLEATLRDHFTLIGGLSDDLTWTGPVRQTARSCEIRGYVPAGWLHPEIELRRAGLFNAMTATACEFGIPSSLLDAVIIQESGYKSWAISPAGAMGLMQIMPGTARALGLRQPWNPVANMWAGARYLARQLERFGRIDLALAAYNAGPERRALALGSIPAIPETTSYVRNITRNWIRLAELGRAPAPTLARAVAATVAVKASGYREVSLMTFGELGT